MQYWSGAVMFFTEVVIPVVPGRGQDSMAEMKDRWSGKAKAKGRAGGLERLTKLGKVVQREGVGGLVRKVLSGEAFRDQSEESPGAGPGPHRVVRSDSSVAVVRTAGEGQGGQEEEISGQEVDQLRKALEDAKLDLLGQTTKLKNEIFDLKKRNSELLEQVVQLTKRERDLAKQVLDIQFQGSGHKADKKRLEIEVRDLKRSLKEAEERAAAAQNALESIQKGDGAGEAESDGETDAAGAEKSEETAVARSDGRQVEALQDALERARLDGKEREQKIVELEHRLEKMEARLKDSKRRIAEKEEQIRSLRSANKRLEKELAGQRADNQGLLRDLDRLRKASVRASEERRRLREASKASQLRTLQSAVSELQSAVLELRDVVDEGAVAVAEHPGHGDDDSGKSLESAGLPGSGEKK